MLGLSERLNSLTALRPHLRILHKTIGMVWTFFKQLSLIYFNELFRFNILKQKVGVLFVERIDGKALAEEGIQIELTGDHPYNSSMMLDADSLFSRGYSVTQIDSEVADSLLAVLRNQTFNEHSGFYPDSVPPQVVSWSNQQTKAPSPISDFWRRLATSQFFHIFTLNFGDFSFFKMSAHRYELNQTLLWHHDFHEAVPVNNILYLSESKVISEEDGGCLQIGKWSIDRNGWGQQSDAVLQTTIVPRHGTLVTLFNMNPSICHAVTPLKAPYGRYSLICRMGYRENYENSYLTKFM